LKNYYETLGVVETASQDEIKKAYRKLVTEHHPDKNGGSKESEDKFKEIAEAYETVGNATKRKTYDASRGPRGHHNSFYDSFQDFSFGGRRSDFKNLTHTVDKWASIKEVMEGISFDIQYSITKNAGGSTSTEMKTLKVSVNLAENGYPITVENGRYGILLKVRGGGSIQETNETDFFGRARKMLVTGDLIVRVNIDMLGLDIDQSDIIQRIELSLHDVLFSEETLLESPLGKKYRIKSFNRDTLNDITVRIPNQGLVSAFGNRGNYVFKIIVNKPDFSKISEEKLQILKDLLLDFNK
jgi:DnaJ-class molecular chaperone